MEALSEFRAAVRAHPNDGYAQYLLAEALQQQGNSEGSSEYMQKVEAATRAVKLDPRLVAAHDLLSSLYIENGHFDLAIEHSQDALALDANDQQAVYHLIVALRKTNQKDRVSALLKRLIELRSKSDDDQKAKERYRLYETPSSTNRTAP